MAYLLVRGWRRVLRVNLQLLQLHELELLLRHNRRIHRNRASCVLRMRRWWVTTEHGLGVGSAQVLGRSLTVASLAKQVFVFADLVFVFSIVLRLFRGKSPWRSPSLQTKHPNPFLMHKLTGNGINDLRNNVFSNHIRMCVDRCVRLGVMATSRCLALIAFTWRQRLGEGVTAQHLVGCVGSGWRWNEVCYLHLNNLLTSCKNHKNVP